MPPVEPFVISRVFNAPRKLVWEVQTSPKHLAKFMGEGWDSKVHDFKVGGIHHYVMGAAGQQMWGKQVFLEIVPMEKLVLTQAFSDPEGGIGAHPMAPTWPKEMLATTTFEDAPSGPSGQARCKMTVTWLPHNSDDIGNATFDGARAGMTGGFGQSFDSLESYLKTLV